MRIHEKDGMKINLTEEAPCCPACDARPAIPGLQQCFSCGMECDLEMNEINHVDQQRRLLLSWGAVMRESTAQN
jgi:hypothetical protein